MQDAIIDQRFVCLFILPHPHSLREWRVIHFWLLQCIVFRGFAKTTINTCHQGHAENISGRKIVSKHRIAYTSIVDNKCVMARVCHPRCLIQVRQIDMIFESISSARYCLWYSSCRCDTALRYGVARDVHWASTKACEASSPATLRVFHYECLIDENNRRRLWDLRRSLEQTLGC
jgi:hypothetical protein